MHAPIQGILTVSTEQRCLDISRKARPPLGIPIGASAPDPSYGRQAGSSSGYSHQKSLNAMKGTWGPDLLGAVSDPSSLKILEAKRKGSYILEIKGSFTIQVERAPRDHLAHAPPIQMGN